ncbi:peptide/nickel transport system substrate-binding protein [Alicyclobacillus sacchari]|uniref:Peptide/nickel transport system substrate-binding protein n=1 Tax=Alicyclobacillus sacchari TaxID=392010 RepID=A0A4R8LKU3_9BACL|nr:ABC transporter substrate-binding protein [Alicyclobacillus sacchari]TDY45197.1 peptide/nickel transport system substrate-binding protein [Alicyclobacillus sacchari]
MDKKRLSVLLATSAVTVAGFAIPAATATAKTLPPLVVCTSPQGTYADNFNPYASGNLAGTLGNVYETLFYFDAVSGHTFDLLGTSYHFSSDNKTLTVNLRHNAKWTDGKAFTAQDVVFTFNAMKKYPDADANGVWQHLASVKAVGNYQVVFTFKTVNVPFAEQYVLGSTYILPQHEWASLGDPAKAKITWDKAIGTGPFIVSYFSSQDYKFKANPNYYLGAPKVPELDYPAFTSNSSADLALAQGNVQYGNLDIPNVQKTYVAANPHNHYYFPPDNEVELYPNLTNPLLANYNVREAISLAIDRNKLSTLGETGYEAVGNPISLPLPNYKSWLDPSLSQSYLKFPAVNDAKAQQLLQAAGFRKDANGIYAKNGKELNFSLEVVSGWSDWDEDCLLIQQDLAKIGIKITINQVNFGTYYSNIAPTASANGVQVGKYDLAISWTNSGPTPYLAYYDMLDSNGSFNVEGFKDPQVDQALNEFASTTDLAKQKQAMYKIERIAADKLPVIPLLTGAYWYEYNDTNYTGWPTKANLWITPGPANYQSAAIVMQHLKPVQ